MLLAVSWAVVMTAGTLGTAQSIQLPRPVPSFNQAYTQGPGAWGHCPLGSDGCPDKLWMTGCLVAAFASVLAYYDVEVSVSASASCTGRARTGMDPGILNDWLRSVGGFGRCAQDQAGSCCLVWARLPAEIEITTHVDRNDVGLNPVTPVVLDHALRQGYPIIAGVHWGPTCSPGSSQTRDCHWVVITGKRGNTYTIIDPYNHDHTSPNGVRTTLDAGVHGAYSINRYVVVRPSSLSAQDWAVQRIPSQASYQPGDRVQLKLSAPSGLPNSRLYARVTTPSGQVQYAVVDAAGRGVLSSTRASLLSTFASTREDWVVYDRTVATQDVGSWVWEFWSEPMDAPGAVQRRQWVVYEVSPSYLSSGWIAFSLILILTIAAATYFLAFAPGAE